MRRLGVVGFFLVAVSSVALAQQPVRGNYLRIPQYQTTGTLNLFIESTGSDINNCISASTPCLTIQAAINKVPKYIKHPVTVTVGTGNFTGARISGFMFDAASDTTGAYLLVQGTMSLSTLASGVNTGTIASATAGTASSTTYATFTVTGAGWTINDLAGRFVRLDTGTGAGQTRVIVSNTATVATIAGAWSTTGSTPTGTTTFSIVEPGTSITTRANLPASVYTSSTARAAFILLGNMISRRDTATVSSNDLVIRRFGWTNAAQQAVEIHDTLSIRIDTTKVSGGSGGGILVASGPQELLVDSVVHSSTLALLSLFRTARRAEVRNSYIVLTTSAVFSGFPWSTIFTDNQVNLTTGTIWS